jgi:uncharacterized protein
MTSTMLLMLPFGLLIGLSLGAVGGGGSILAVPVFVFVAGQTSKEATASSLFVVGTSAIFGLAPHLRAKRTRVGPGVAFGLSGVGGSYLGSRLNSRLDPNVLLLAFAILVLVAAWAMWRRHRVVDKASQPATSIQYLPIHGASRNLSTRTVAKVTIAGSFVGFLTGFFGVGGGFVIVPALVLSLGFTMPEAAGTSLLVIAINSGVSLLLKGSTVVFDWALIVPFTAVALIGVQFGAALSGRLNPRTLTNAFVGLLLCVGAYTGLRASLQLL